MCPSFVVAMDGAASEAVRGIKAEKDSDLNQIWEALAVVLVLWTNRSVQCDVSMLGNSKRVNL